MFVALFRNLKNSLFIFFVVTIFTSNVFAVMPPYQRGEDSGGSLGCSSLLGGGRWSRRAVNRTEAIRRVLDQITKPNPFLHSDNPENLERLSKISLRLEYRGFTEDVVRGYLTDAWILLVSLKNKQSLESGNQIDSVNAKNLFPYFLNVLEAMLTLETIPGLGSSNENMPSFEEAMKLYDSLAE